MMNEANNNNACSCCSSAQVCTQAVNAPLCEARRCSAQSAMAQAKKQTLKQPMKQAIKQPARELARWCHNTAQDQHSKASLMQGARSSIFRWYSTYCISVLTTNMHP
jgi:hypothetical protein